MTPAETLAAAQAREFAAYAEWQRLEQAAREAQQAARQAECEYLAAIQARRLAEERAAANEQPIVVRLKGNSKATRK